MIDTDKYEGHSKGPWYWDGNLCNDEYSDKHGVEQWTVLDWELGVGDADKQLIADAPLLLAEVKRLREKNDELHAQRVQISWIQEARGGQSKAFELLAEVKRLREQGSKLIEAAERVRSDISDQDTGWYYQLGNHIEKMNRLVRE